MQTSNFKEKIIFFLLLFIFTLQVTATNIYYENRFDENQICFDDPYSLIGFEKNTTEDPGDPEPIPCTPEIITCELGEKLKKRGFINVTNLYGSIFEWANEGLLLVDENNQPTQKIHTYNKRWSKWVEEGKAEKVW